MGKDINRLKIVLAEQKKTNKWLAQQLGKDPATVSKWCTNTAQPSLETLSEIAECLQIDVRKLLHSTYIYEMVSEPLTEYRRKEDNQ